VASNYPGSLDSFDTIASDKKTSDSVGGRTHRDMHNDLGDAIEAVQGELGTTRPARTPQSKHGSRRSRAATLPQVDAKGDLVVGTADNTYDNLTVGTNDTVLVADSAQSKGVKWAQIADANVAAGAAISRSKISGLPTSSTDNTLPRFDGTGGALQTSGIVVADTTNAISGVGAITSSAMATATLGSDLGDGVSLTQALTGLTIGQTYQVGPVSGTMTAATLDGTALTCILNATSFVATATSHTVVGTAGTATAISVKLVTARSADVAVSAGGARVSQGQTTNTFLGTLPLKLTTGTHNTGVGQGAQIALTTGYANTAVGQGAQLALTTGYANTVIGQGSQPVLTGGLYNNCVGVTAQSALTTGNYNNSIGNGSLNSVTTGTYNNAVGSNAGRAFTTGSYNLALGAAAGFTGTTATLSGTVCIGTNSSGTGAQATADNQIVLGVSQHSTLIAGSLEMTGSGTGIIVRSPDGTRYRLGVANGGAVSVAAL
jgi:hypothetical protein